MQWFKIPLIAAAVLVLIALFRNRQKVELRAGSRLATIVLVALAIASIADPNLTQKAADVLGIGRGTDLILYLLVVVFTLTSLGLYFRLRETDQRVRQLARAMAVEQALNAQPFQQGATTTPRTDTDETPQRSDAS